MRDIQVNTSKCCHMATIRYTGSMPRLVDTIRDAVRESDQSAGGIAKGAGVARSQLSRLLSGKRGMSVEGIERLAEYLGLEIVVQEKLPRKGR